MKLNIAVLPGDGIGPEVTAQAKKVLKAIALEFGHKFNFKEAVVGACAIDKTGSPLPEETLKLCKSNDAVLFGAIGDPKYDNDPEDPLSTARIGEVESLVVTTDGNEFTTGGAEQNENVQQVPFRNVYEFIENYTKELKQNSDDYVV